MRVYDWERKRSLLVIMLKLKSKQLLILTLLLIPLVAVSVDSAVEDKQEVLRNIDSDFESISLITDQSVILDCRDSTCQFPD